MHDPHRYSYKIFFLPTMLAYLQLYLPTFFPSPRANNGEINGFYFSFLTEFFFLFFFSPLILNYSKYVYLYYNISSKKEGNPRFKALGIEILQIPMDIEITTNISKFLIIT